jgi:hypothetical protein
VKRNILLGALLLMGLSGAIAWVNRPQGSAVDSLKSAAPARSADTIHSMGPSSRGGQPGILKSAVPSVSYPDPDPPAEHPRIPHFQNARMVSWADLPVDRSGISTRVEILETGFKYPLVRMSIERKFDTQGRLLFSRPPELMVADHVNLEKPESLTLGEFSDAVTRSGAHVMRQIGESQVFLIAFEGHSPLALAQTIENLKKSGAGEAEPDYIRTLR